MAFSQRELDQMALIHPCYKGDLFTVRRLIKEGHNVNTRDEDGNTPLIQAAWRGHDQVVEELIREGAHVNIKDNGRRNALYWASLLDHSSIVQTLCAAGADTNVQDHYGWTPLICAAWRGRDEIVCELIRAGASVNVVTSRIRTWKGELPTGSTALHYAAEYDRIKCWILLVEAGADMTIRNKECKTPLDLAFGDFQQTVQQAQSSSTKRIVAVIGNAEHGKSTLIAALQAEGKSIFKKVVNWFAQVQDISQRTAGIEAVEFSSHKYGQTLFYDFAGQADYHGPHQSFLEAMLSKPGASVTLLLLVKVTDEDDVIIQHITRWLQPLALTSAPSTPQVILVGSFLDRVKSKEEAAGKLLRCSQSVQEELPFDIQGPCLLDCRKPESEGINQICAFFQEIQPLQFNSDILSYNLRWVLILLQEAFSVPAITLHTFQSWLLKNAGLLSMNFPAAVEVCCDLTAIGHALFLPNRLDPFQSWLVLDLQAVLHNVYGTLFSGSRGKVNQFGLLHCSQLVELFPELNPTMIQEVLISLDFCIQVDSKLLRGDLVKLTAGTEGEGWLYFPALVSAQPPELFPKDTNPHRLQWVCWQLRTEEKHLISAHLLQSIILHLASNHVFAHELASVREHCCSVWMNGLSWRSTKGVDIAVHVSDCSVVQVVGHSKAAPEKLLRYMSTIVRDVIKMTTQLSPKLKATSYIVHPYTPAMLEDTKAPPLDSLYPVSSIVHCISNGDDHVLSRQQVGHLPNQMSLTELFGGWCPSLSVVQDMGFQKEPQRGECVFPLPV